MRRRAGSSDGRGAGAFTLVEVMVSVVVLGVIAAVTLPVVSGVTNSYAAAADVREKTERVAFAMDRCLRLLRECPAGADASAVSITSASPSAVVLGDGRGLQLSGTDLLLLSGSSTSPLCRNVTAFVITYRGTDGTTSTQGTPGSTHCFDVSITADGVTLSGSAFPRARMIKP